VGGLHATPSDLGVFREVDEGKLAPRDPAPFNETALLLTERDLAFPDLKKNEAQSSTWSGHDGVFR